MSRASPSPDAKSAREQARTVAEDTASFRDPSGFVYWVDSMPYRQVNRSYREDYDLLVASGLYDALVADGLLLPHEEVAGPAADPEEAYRVLAPQPVPFLSYPYEWCFGQLRAGGLLTLKAQQRAMEFGMRLKDASAFNVQFRGHRPVLIDTLSFERHREGEPWVAYRQFCQHFLAPLALMHHRDVRLGQLLRLYPDGVPLDLASSLLPMRSWLHPSLLVHLHLHAGLERRYGGQDMRRKGGRVAGEALVALVSGLRQALQRLRPGTPSSAWLGYYEDTVYGEDGLRHKEELVGSFLEEVRPASVWDLGANVGRFSRLASGRGIPTVAFELDAVAVEVAFRRAAQEDDRNLLCLVLDLANPSSGLGWAGRERRSLADRGPADLVLVLALTHHLALAHNVPFDRQAAFLRELGRWLVVEFVPPEDPQARSLLERKPSLAGRYSQASFAQGFGRYFEAVREARVGGTARSVYLLRRR